MSNNGENINYREIIETNLTALHNANVALSPQDEERFKAIREAADCLEFNNKTFKQTLVSMLFCEHLGDVSDALCTALKRAFNFEAKGNIDDYLREFATKFNVTTLYGTEISPKQERGENE